MSTLISWCIESTYFKKYSAFFGGLALGVYVQARYWKQISATLQVWGLDRSEYLQACLLIAGASGILTSIGLSLVKSQREKSDVKPCEKSEEKP